LQSYGTASESGGTLNLVPDANTGSSLILVSSASTYSLAGSQAAVKASSVPSTAGSVDVQFSLLIDNQNYLQWYCENGFLYAFWAKGGVRAQVARLDYAAAAHAWWRIRESGGTVYWETSADGAVYSVQTSVFDLQLVRHLLVAGEVLPGDLRGRLRQSRAGLVGELQRRALRHPAGLIARRSSRWDLAGLVVDGERPNAGDGDGKRRQPRSRAQRIRGFFAADGDERAALLTGRRRCPGMLGGGSAKVPGPSNGTPPPME
jgi:hypothetical protein